MRKNKTYILWSLITFIMYLGFIGYYSHYKKVDLLPHLVGFLLLTGILVLFITGIPLLIRKFILQKKIFLPKSLLLSLNLVLGFLLLTFICKHTNLLPIQKSTETAIFNAYFFLFLIFTTQNLIGFSLSGLVKKIFSTKT